MGKDGAVLQSGGIMNLGGKDVLHVALKFWLWSCSVCGGGSRCMCVCTQKHVCAPAVVKSQCLVYS